MPEFMHLLDGYRRFRTGGWIEQRARWAELAQGQSPRLMVIACSDSRVEPGRIFDTDPGELFVVRNVANLVPPCEADGGRHGVSAALEFAVCELAVRHIVVLGHASCGGVAAALSGRDLGSARHGFIDDWVAILDDARTRVLATNDTDRQRALELEAVRVSLANLRSFPFVAEREAAGALKLHGAYFALDDGVLHILDETTGAFAPA